MLIANPTDLLIGVINACAQNQGNRVCRDSLEVVHIRFGDLGGDLLKSLHQVAAQLFDARAVAMFSFLKCRQEAKNPEIVHIQLAPLTIRKHRLLACIANTMNVVRTVLHKVAQSTAFNQWRDFCGASATISSLQLHPKNMPTAANILSSKLASGLITR